MARTKDFDENEVLNKAIAIFWYKGYNGTSMQDLVDGLGISRSSLYDTYGDKHTLYLKALESYKTEGASRVCAIVNGSGTAKEIFKRLLELAVGELLLDEKQKGCFMVNAEVENALHDAEVGKLICENDQQVEDAFYTVIKQGQEGGEINNSKDARALARFTFNTIKGIRVTAKSITDKAVFDDIIKLALAALD